MQALLLLLSLSVPLPAPAPGAESFSEVIDRLKAKPEPEQAARLRARGGEMATSPPYVFLLEEAAGASSDGLTQKRPLPLALPNIKPGDADPVWVLTAAAAASLAYEDAEAISAQVATWGYEPPTFFENTVPGTRAWVAERADHVLVVFCGTEPGVVDPIVDLSVDTIKAPKYGPGRVHRGFELQLSSVWSKLARTLVAARKKDKARPHIFTGHSLGGALATLAFARTRTGMLYPSIRGGGPSARLITFGAPRTGDEVFASNPSFSRGALRVVHRDDPVPHAIARGLGYRHHDGGRVLWFQEREARFEKNEDPATDKLPQDLDMRAIAAWIDKGKLRFEDHAESNYVVLAERFQKASSKAQIRRTP